MDEVTIDPHYPWRVQVHRLGRQPGSRALLQLEAAPDQPWGDEVSGLGPQDPLAVRASLEAVGEGVLVTGQVRGLAHGQCIRCLDPVSVPLQLDVQELFTYDDTRSARRQQRAAVVEQGEVEQPLVVRDETVDLLPMVRDAVVLALPAQPLCRPDCPGLCSQCGQPLAQEPDHRHETADPRWAALAGLELPPTP